MSKTIESNNLGTPYADLGTAYVNQYSREYKDRFSPGDRPAVRTLRFDGEALGNSVCFSKGEILYLKETGFVRIALIEESWDEPSHEHFEIEYILIHCVPVIPEERLECRGGACRLAPIYDHAVTEPPRLLWRREDGSLLAAAAPAPVQTRRDHVSQTSAQTVEAITTYAAVYASSVFSFVTGALLTRFVF